MTLRLANILMLMACLSFLAPLTSSAAEPPINVAITGVEGKLYENVQAALALPPALSETADRFWVDRYIRQIPDKAKEALKAFGYYNAEVTTNLKSEKEKQYLVEVTIHPGDPVTLGIVRIAVEGPGRTNQQIQEAVRAFPFHRGEVLSQALYEDAKNALKSAAVNAGYLDANFSKHEIRISVSENKADIELILQTGELYYFDSVVFTSKTEYPEHFLRRYIAFEEGAPFSYPRLGQTQLNFRDSDRFREVMITPRPDLATDRRVPVEVFLVQSLPKRLRPGVGYGTDTGARFSLLYEDLNVFHLTHQFAAELMLAERRQTVGSSYTVPHSRNINTSTTFRFSLDRESPDAYVSRSINAEVERSHGFSRGTVGSVFVRVLNEYDTINRVASRSTMIIPGVRFSRRGYTELVRPQKGYYLSMEARGAHQYFGSETGLLQFLGSANTLIPLPLGLSVFLRGEGGTTLQNEPLQEVPASLRFFAGGDRSVRGYAYKALGPHNAAGEVEGGKHLLVGSIELEEAIGKKWGIAAFYDIGNAFNDFLNIRMAEGIGIGVRRYTVVGPISIDVARQLNVPNPGFRLHVTVGFGW